MIQITQGGYRVLSLIPEVHASSDPNAGESQAKGGDLGDHDGQSPIRSPEYHRHTRAQGDSWQMVQMDME